MFVGRRGGKSTTPCSGCSRATLQPSSSMQPKFEYSVDTRQWFSSQRLPGSVMSKTKNAEDTSASTRTDIDFSRRNTQHTETGQAERGSSLGWMLEVQGGLYQKSIILQNSHNTNCRCL